MPTGFVTIARVARETDGRAIPVIDALGRAWLEASLGSSSAGLRRPAAPDGSTRRDGNDADRLAQGPSREPHPDRRSQQEERQVQSTDGAAQLRTAVIAAARENRSLSSCMISSCLATCRMLNTAGGIGRRCGATRVHAWHISTGQLSHQYRMAKPFRGPKRRTSPIAIRQARSAHEGEPSAATSGRVP